MVPNPSIPELAEEIRNLRQMLKSAVSGDADAIVTQLDQAFVRAVETEAQTDLDLLALAGLAIDSGNIAAAYARRGIFADKAALQFDLALRRLFEALEKRVGSVGDRFTMFRFEYSWPQARTSEETT
jgi:hypothetical protein